MASLKLANLSCVFQSPHGPVRAVDDLSLDVADGELVALVGPSGSGKSTTLRLIAGLETPTSGTIEAGGRILNQLPPRDRNIAMVFQSYALYPHMTVRENLGFGPRVARVPESQREQEVTRVAERLGLTKLLDRMPHQLSGGEQQRVALGRAMIRKPQLFLMDEPLASLDPSLRVAARSEIKRLQRELATSMIYVTHDQEEAMTLADRIGILNHGRLQQFDIPSLVFGRPANQFVAGFFGSPSMNFLRGRIQKAGGSVTFCTDGLIVSLDPAKCPISMTNGDVIIGIRPHQILRASKSNGIPAKVRNVEFLGDAVIVRATAGGASELVAKFPVAETISSGDILQLEFPTEGLHFFAADESGRRLD